MAGPRNRRVTSSSADSRFRKTVVLDKMYILPLLDSTPSPMKRSTYRPLKVELLHSMVAAIGYVDIAMSVYGYTGRAVELADVVSARTHSPDVVAIRIELLQSVVAPVAET